MPERLSGVASKRKPGHMPERTSEDMSDRMSDSMLSKQKRMSDGTSKDCYKDMPERMSE